MCHYVAILTHLPVIKETLLRSDRMERVEIWEQCEMVSLIYISLSVGWSIYTLVLGAKSYVTYYLLLLIVEEHL